VDSLVHGFGRRSAPDITVAAEILRDEPVHLWENQSEAID
jgi:hypothetical protein